METALVVELCLSVFLLPSVGISASQVESQPSNLHLDDFDGAPSLASRPLDILLMSPPFWGHIHPTLAVAEELVARGHIVTLCVGINDEHRKKFENKITGYGVKFCHFSSDVIVRMVPSKDKPFHHQILHFGRILGDYSSEMVHHVSQSFSSKSFDLLGGTEFAIAALACFNSLWNVPIVTIGTTMPMFSHLQPQWAWPSMLVGSSDDLSFSQRAINVIEKFAFPIAFSTLLVSPSKNSLQSFCPSVSLSEMAFGAGVSFPYIVPTVMGFDYPRTQFPLVEYVGPMLSRSPQALSAEMADWLSSKPDQSVVYISMGSVWEVDKVSAAAMVHGVMKTNYSLLWSLRKSNQWVLEGLEIDSSRVLISEWTPQLSVLGSRAIHSAILHGGFNGLSEALSSGIPVIGFPLMPEQATNIGRLYHNQLGLQLDASTVSSSVVADAIGQIDTGKYRQNTKKLQKLFKFAGGVRRAADLIEYYEEVGYNHLIPAYVKYNWNSVQYYNLDVYAVLLMVVGAVLACFVALLRCIFNLVASYFKPKFKSD